MSKSTKIIAALGVVAGLGVAALPLSTYAATDSKDVTFSVEVGESISLAVDNATVATTTALAAGQALTSGLTTTATVITNAAGGYTLTIADKDADTNLVGTTDTNATIATGASLTAGTEAWAVKGGNLTDWTAMVASTDTALVLADTNTATAAAGENTPIDFGVSTAATTKADTYTDVVTLTATTK